MNMKNALLFFIILGLNTNVRSQNTPTLNSLGLNYAITSTILNEDRQIQIYTPDNYNDTDKSYPVLYLLDGQRLFPLGVSLLKSFTQFQQTPEFIFLIFKRVIRVTSD